MKVILVLLAIYVLWWLLRRSFAEPRRPGPAAAAPPPLPQPVLACAYCGVHLPQDETLAGAGGVFCDEAHRAAFERQKAPPR